MNIPNLISLFRILLIPLFIYTFMNGIGADRIIYPIVIFIVSGFSDMLDGYIARKYHMETKLGAVLDPLADKLMLVTALLCFTYYKYIPIWIVLLVILKEGLMITGGYIAYRRGIVNRANVWGKMSTFLFHISIIMFLFSNTLAIVLLIISISVSFVAFFTYLKLTLAKRKNGDSNQRPYFD